MIAARSLFCLAVACAIFVASGCRTPGPSAARFAVRRVPDADPDRVFSVAQDALVDHGYPVGRVDAARGMIVSEPILTSTERERAAGVDIRSRFRLRRVATVHVSPSDGIVAIYCQVAIEELATEGHRIFTPERHGSDVPAQTPIERDAATTVEQNTVWAPVRRDKLAERQILETILKRLAE